MHETGARVSAQIGHAGPVANARSNGVPSIAPSRRFNPLAMAFDREATRDDLERIIAAHAQAAAYAIEVGFDAVEIHLGHNYLPSAFLSPKINQRKDEWGGPLTARAEFPRRIVEAVRRTAAGQIAVLAKLNMSDGSPGGFGLDESLAFARMLEADGHLDAIELTGGSSLLNPMYLFRGDVPLREFAAQQSPWCCGSGSARSAGRYSSGTPTNPCTSSTSRASSAGSCPCRSSCSAASPTSTRSGPP